MAKLTLFSVYNYCRSHGIDLFESFDTLNPEVDKNTLIGKIMLRGGEFGVVYADPSFMKEAIGVWSAEWSHTIDRWLKIQNEEYNPLHNYDRHEEYTDTSTEESHNSGSSTGDDNATNTESKRTYDSADMKDVAQSGNISHSGLTSNADMNGKKEFNHSAHLYGNIGVTTASQLQIEARAAERWSLYDNIAGLFINEFCIPVYE